MIERVARVVGTSRPRFWLYTAGPVFVGLAYAVDSPTALGSPVVLGLALYCLVPANVYLYGVNDIFDRDVDADNPKKSGRERRFLGDPVVVAAVLVSALLGLGVLVLLPDSARVWFGGFLVLATLYSVPPVRFKTRPGLDSVSNGLYILPGVAAYTAVSGVSPPLLVIVAGWVWAMGMHTFSAIPDIESDRGAGIETTATVLGRQGALEYCGVMWFVAAVLFGLVDVRAGLLLGVYPVVLGLVWVTDRSLQQVYWWFPWVNTGVGFVLTIAGLGGLVYA